MDGPDNKKKRGKARSNQALKNVPPIRVLWLATRLLIDCFKARGYTFEIKRFQTKENLFQEYVQNTVLKDGDMHRLWIEATEIINCQLMPDNPKNQRQVMGCLLPDVQLNKKPATQLLEDLKTKHVYRAIIIWPTAGSPFAVKMLREQFLLQTWTYTLVQSQFYRAACTMAHKRLNPIEKDQFYRRYHLKPENVGALMKTNTQMAAFLGVKKNDIVKIFRVTEAGLVTDYRRVE